ncbi:hypothetical protein [Streptomyces sp. NPDC013457]|uniref:hypothetical protein n=1 Tax=Streptomyces sp. NPDC013457 TaxID=3364866 RepID=UPI0036F657F6
MAAVVPLALVTTACSSDAPPQAGPPDDYVCDIASGSSEEKLLLQVIRANSFETRIGNRVPDFVEKMSVNLRGEPEGQVTQSVRQCEYLPKGVAGDGQATIEYRWAPLTEATSGKDPEGTSSYRFDGATGKSHDTMTDLYVQCELPGELKARSKKVLLHADASFTMNLGPVKDHGTQDQQMSFVHQMTRRATEVLGCENKPLAKDPVVKPLTEGSS